MSHYETETKPALRNLRQVALGGQRAPGTLAQIKEAIDAAAEAGATKKVR